MTVKRSITEPSRCLKHFAKGICPRCQFSTESHCSEDAKECKLLGSSLCAQGWRGVSSILKPLSCLPEVATSGRQGIDFGSNQRCQPHTGKYAAQLAAGKAYRRWGPSANAVMMPTGLLHTCARMLASQALRCTVQVGENSTLDVTHAADHAVYNAPCHSPLQQLNRSSSRSIATQGTSQNSMEWTSACATSLSQQARQPGTRGQACASAVLFTASRCFATYTSNHSAKIEAS